jgi:hypothetical protein
MAEYGTIEYFQEQLNKNLKEKAIYCNALKNIVREEGCGAIIDGELFELIVDRIYFANVNIKFNKGELAKLYQEELEKGKSEENAD